jgi:signal transduction histidine kinase/ActR/RegA family two-component response regulator
MVRTLLFPTLVWGVTLSIFLLDALTPSSIAIAVLYGAVILLAASKWPARAVVRLSLLCLLLTLIAYGLGHRFNFFGDAFGRCVVSLSAILIITFLALKGQAATQALREREETLRQAGRQKDEFLAVLAHELRNPIAPINGAAHLLRMSLPGNEDVDEATDIIIRQSNRLSALVDDLLDASRVAKCINALEKSEVNMRRVVTEAVEQVRPLMDASGHKLTVQLPEQPVKIIGDHKRLVQVVTKLLNNAASFTPDGGAIRLQLRQEQGQVVLAVTDNGIGISPGFLPHFFEWFTQAKRVPDRTKADLGVGLALVKNLVELHGGSVEVSSGGNFAGSTFTVSLPSATDVESAPPPLGAISGTISGSPMRILVVDDKPDVAKMLAKFLVAAGHDAIAVNDAKEALTIAARKTFDAYFLDIGLPGTDGNALARHLRQMPSAKDALIVAITGYGQKFNREQSLESGFNYYFVKPVNPIELVAILVKWKNKECLETAPHNADEANGK